jgi:virginiamycin B lyase
MRWWLPSLAAVVLLLTVNQAVFAQSSLQEYDVPRGSHPHDVAPAADGGIWFTAQSAGYLGWLDPSTGDVRQVPLGPHSAPHGVIVGPDGAAWVTDGGQNAILRVDPTSFTVSVFPVPSAHNVDLNTATFDHLGHLWFTGQSGFYGRVDPATGAVLVSDAPRGPGAYGMTTTPDGSVFFASLASSYVGHIDPASSRVDTLDPPTPGQGARRVWTDSRGDVWVSEWSAGQLARYDPAADQWREWRLPGDHPMPYAVYVDDQDQVWLSDWGSSSIVHFDPSSEAFTESVAVPAGADVRQLHGRPGEVWGAESGRDRLFVVHHG